MAPRQWLIDGNNVMGARPDRWWNDRRAAAVRLTQQIAEWCRTHDGQVVVVFDGTVDETVERLAGGNLRVIGSTRRGRNAADDRIVELAGDAADQSAGRLTVVTSDRGLVARLAPEVTVVGAGSFRDTLDHHAPSTRRGHPV